MDLPQKKPQESLQMDVHFLMFYIKEIRKFMSPKMMSELSNWPKQHSMQESVC